MKKKKLIIFFIIFIVLTSLVVRCEYKTSLGNLTTEPNGSIIHMSESAKKDYKLLIYLIEPEEGDIGVNSNIRGVLVKGDKRKNIYLEHEQNQVEVKWINDTTVVINEKKLNVLKDVYDSRDLKK